MGIVEHVRVVFSEPEDKELVELMYRCSEDEHAEAL